MQTENTLQTEETQINPRIVRTSANANQTIQFEHFEFVPNVSETVPDMILDLRTMISRRQNGMAVPTFPGGYSQEDFPDIEKMDEVEILQYRIDLAETMEKQKDEYHVLTKKLEELQKPVSNNPVTPTEPEPNPE